jgi:hypothetical protein
MIQIPTPGEAFVIAAGLLFVGKWAAQAAYYKELQPKDRTTDTKATINAARFETREEAFR